MHKQSNFDLLIKLTTSSSKTAVAHAFIRTAGKSEIPFMIKILKVRLA